MFARALVAAAALLALTAGPLAAQTLNLLVSAGGSGRTFESSANQFREQTGINVRVIQYPYAEVREKQLLELVGQTGNIDIVSIDGSIWLPELTPFLKPLDDVNTSNLIPSMVDLFRSDGKLLALPVRIAGWVLIYRKDLLDQAGLTPPKTWAEFRAAATTLTKDGVYGFVPALKQGNYLVVQWIPFLFGHGGAILTPDKKHAAFNTPAGLKATEYFVGLVKDGLVPPGAKAYEQSDIITAMSQGIGAMAITYSPYYLNMNSAKESKVAGKLDIAPFLPYDPDAGLKTGRTLISGWGFGVADSSRHPDEAKQFIQFIAGDSEQKRIAVDNNNAPTSAAVYRDPDYLKAFPAAASVLTALESAEDRPLIENWTEVEDILARELSAAISGLKTPQQALSDAEKAVNAAL
ncbi:extracellular solute-binding protein [Pleomorphomonas carboxyditropha]|nr:extracellular solute-binding protein [Pleomorphomonas carboxyditropha]